MATAPTVPAGTCRPYRPCPSSTAKSAMPGSPPSCAPGGRERLLRCAWWMQGREWDGGHGCLTPTTGRRRDG
ncbi:hypothetical protein T484DRAFT_2543263 [Baffinella frigidus]|nr:hypothetical protein T484DRAFT_2543263 [Cryptophyta sp. CCMP2293]